MKLKKMKLIKDLKLKIVCKIYIIPWRFISHDGQ